jgi:hypothetical protein
MALQDAKRRFGARRRGLRGFFTSRWLLTNEISDTQVVDNGPTINLVIYLPK